MIRDLDIIKNIDYLFEKKVVLYGAGLKGEKVYSMYKDSGINLFAFADSDSERWGTQYFGLPVISYDELSDMADRDEIAIIITSIYYVKEIEKELDKMELAVRRTYSCFGLDFSVYKNIEDIRFQKSFVEEYLEKKNLWKDMYRFAGHVHNEYLSCITWPMIHGAFRHGNPVWTFSAGKVASQSIHYYLLEKGIPSIHIHDVFSFFRNESLDQDDQQRIIDYVFCNDKEEVKIITGIREPISRDISLFFELLDDGTWNGTNQEQIDLEKRCIDFCQCMIQKREQNEKIYNYNWVNYLNEHVKYGAMFDWFDLEVKELFGLDVFDYEFPKDKGYQIITKGNVKIFLFRLDVLGELDQPLGEFLGVSDFEVPRLNTADVKGYSFAYKQMLQEIHLPQEYIDFYYKNNPRMNHFYSEKQKSEMIKRWARK